MKNDDVIYCILVIITHITSSGINTGIMAASTENVPENMVILSNKTDEASYLLKQGYY